MKSNGVITFSQFLFKFLLIFMFSTISLACSDKEKSKPEVKHIDEKESSEDINYQEAKPFPMPKIDDKKKPKPGDKEKDNQSNKEKPPQGSPGHAPE